MGSEMCIRDRLRNAFKKVQFIISTHDPLCIRGMYDGEVYVVHKDENGQVRLLDNLPHVENLSAEQLLTSDFFGLWTTNPETESRLAEYALLLHKQNSEGITNDELVALERHANYLGSMPVADERAEEAGIKLIEEVVNEEPSMPGTISEKNRDFLKEVLGKYQRNTD